MPFSCVKYVYTSIQTDLLKEEDYRDSRMAYNIAASNAPGGLYAKTFRSAPCERT